MLTGRPALMALGVTLLVGIAVFVPACACPETQAEHKTEPVARASEAGARPPSAESIEAWQSETFALPPDFAPDLPTGTESLRFSPGWRDPKAEGFWSYAFVIWIDEPAPDAARIDELLETYYNGLMGTFAAGAGKDISKSPARVDVDRIAPGRYEARMHLIDAFATFKPIDLRVVVDSVAEGQSRASLRVRVSPKPRGHAIWHSLDAAIVLILKRDAQAKPVDQSSGSAVGSQR